MIDTMGLIFSSNNETNLGELEVIRSVAALPFAGRYRLIDFVLSGMVNSGIINVGVTTDYNYRSLLDMFATSVSKTLLLNTNKVVPTLQSFTKT